MGGVVSHLRQRLRFGGLLRLGNNVWTSVAEAKCLCLKHCVTCKKSRMRPVCEGTKENA